MGWLKMLPYRTGFADGLRPDPLFSVSEWADNHRVLSGKSAEPGPWRTSRTPYLAAIMDALGPSEACQEITFAKGAQIGGTEAGINWLGFIIQHSPGPTLVVEPTIEMVRRLSKQRIDTMLSDCPSLRDKVKEAPRDKFGGRSQQTMTMLEKTFPGGTLVLTGAESEVGLRSMAVRYLMLDECDVYPGDLDKLGDPVQLAIARCRTFKLRRKIYRCSTPTIKGHSRIETAFNEGTGELYHIPCPMCGEMQPLVFNRLKWDHANPDGVMYECVGCNERFPEHYKTEMLRLGEWQAARPELLDIHRSFHLNSLYSPIGWMSWSDIARDWEACHKDPSRLKVFINTIVGESWEDRGEAPEWRKLYDRREQYRKGVVPMAARFLTAGADIQGDRIEVSIYGWGRNRESWLVDHIVLDGSTADMPVWEALTTLLQGTWPHESGVSLTLARLAVDSNFRTQEVYRWARGGAGRVLVIRGMEHGSAPVGQPTAVEVSVGGKTIQRGVRVWPIATSMLKSEFYGWLHSTPPTHEELLAGAQYPPGYCHFTAEVCDEEFFKQLTAEQLMTRVIKGFPKQEWQKMRERNETLDCRVYARAAALVVGLDRFTEQNWLQLEQQFTGVAVPVPQRGVRGRFDL